MSHKTICCSYLQCLHNSGWYLGNTKNSCSAFLCLIEGTDVVVNSIDDDVWEYEDERTGALNDGVESWD